MLLYLTQYDDHYYMMNWIIAIFGPFWWIAMIIGMLSYAILSILICVFIYKNAVKRKIPNPEVWLLIGLIFNLIGLIIYLLIRSTHESKEIKEVKRSDNPK
ncbi:MAG: hypothetical protein P8Y97_16145 [Candidatus Lokiarchaeota archaeon]